MDRDVGRGEGLATAWLPTGLRDLDRISGGGRHGDLWTVAGASGVGRTAFALGIARTVALRARVPVGWLSTQHEPAAMIEAALCAEGRLVADWLRADALTDADRERLERAQDLIDNASLTFASESPATILRAATGMAEGGGVQVLVVDECPESREVSALEYLKTLALHTGVWLIAVVPDLGLGRRAARRAATSGADLALWVQRDDLHEPKHPRCGEADISVVRGGRRTAMTTVAFQGHYSRFVEMALN